MADKLSKYFPVVLTANVSHLSAAEKQALALLHKAAVPLNLLYQRQSWKGNADVRKTLKGDDLKFFDLNAGPWDRLSDAPFLPNVPSHPPPGANFYPEDMTLEEFDRFAAENELAKHLYTVVVRDSAGKLKAVKYSEAYADVLVSVADDLRKAGALLPSGSLKKFIEMRADALISNEYQPSDKAWVDVDWASNNIEVTFGPYENYTDKLLNLKAAYEAFISIIDHSSTKKLVEYSSHMQTLEDNLPIPNEYKNPQVGTAPPIVVVDQVFSAGDVAGPKTAAYNLPNDEQVIKEKGAKMIILKNVQEAKFDSILRRIAGIVLNKEQVGLISFNSFFTHILLHEMSHSLGPHSIVKDGKQTTVRNELQEYHSALEECKADIAGLWAAVYLMKNNSSLLSTSEYESMFVTYLASAFRSIRFGLNEAHGKGQAVQLNFLLDYGAFVYNQSEKSFAVNFGKMEQGIDQLVNKVMVIQAKGDKEAAKKLLDEYGVLRPFVAEALERIEADQVPTDIRPTYALFEQETSL